MFTSARLLTVLFVGALAAAPAMAWDRDDHRGDWNRHDRHEYHERYERHDNDRFRRESSRVEVRYYSAPTVYRAVPSCEPVTVVTPAPACAEPAVVYTAPPTCAPPSTVVYSAPPPVIVQPAPRVVYRPAPVIVCPAPEPSFNLNFGFRFGH